MRAIVIQEPGGPQVLQLREVPQPSVESGSVLVRNEAIGLNFLDVYFRTGRYPAAYPLVIGHEGAGIVEAVGAGVTEFAVGDRVGYLDQIGAYAERVSRPASRLVRIPPGMTSRQAAAVLLKGMTAEYLLRRTFRVEAGHVILVHAAAGGVGQILCQWARRLGATVIGTVGSERKRAVAQRAGCHHVIVNETQDFVDEVRRLTGGHGVAVVYDGVGGDSFARSLDCLAPRGLLAAFGAAAGPIPPLDVQSLGPKGALYVTRPMIGPYIADTASLRASAEALFDQLLSGHVTLPDPNTYALADAAKAHADLEARRLMGTTVLLP